MKAKIKGYIVNHLESNQFIFSSCSLDSEGFVTVMPLDIEVEIPIDFDPRAKQVEQLKKDIADFQNRITENLRKISELTAITCEVTK